MKIHFSVHVFSDFSNNTPHQNSQSQSASFTCGYRPGLLPPGFLTKCLPLSAAEGVSPPTLHTHNTYTVSAFFYAKLSSNLYFLHSWLLAFYNFQLEVLIHLPVFTLHHWLCTLFNGCSLGLSDIDCNGGNLGLFLLF